MLQFVFKIPKDIKQEILNDFNKIFNNLIFIIIYFTRNVWLLNILIFIF